LITVDEKGENSIVVASGANANLVPEDIKNALEVLEEADIIVMQLEIPMETVEFVAEYAATHGIRVILNPAPMNKLKKTILNNIDIITPNETEAERLTRIKIKTIADAERAAKSIHEMGVNNVVITLGAKGAVICEKGILRAVDAPKVE